MKKKSYERIIVYDDNSVLGYGCFYTHKVDALCRNNIAVFTKKSLVDNTTKICIAEKTDEPTLLNSWTLKTTFSKYKLIDIIYLIFMEVQGYEKENCTAMVEKEQLEDCTDKLEDDCSI